MKKGFFRSVQHPLRLPPQRLWVLSAFLPLITERHIRLISFDFAPELQGGETKLPYSFSEEPDCAPDSFSGSPRLSGYCKLAHPQLEVKVCYGEHLTGRQFRPRKGRPSEVVELPSTVFATVALDIWPVWSPTIASDFSEAQYRHFTPFGHLCLRSISTTCPSERVNFSLTYSICYRGSRLSIKHAV